MLKHSWRGEHLADGWYVMTCQRCRRTVLHRLDGSLGYGQPVPCHPAEEAWGWTH